MTKPRITQLPAEVAGYQPPKKRITQVAIEVAITVRGARSWGQIITKGPKAP